MPAHGLDISNHQLAAARNLGRPIDWTRAALGGVQFGWVKATEGASFRDPYIRAMIDGFRSARIPTGLYHFARPGNPVEQARYFHAYGSQVDGFRGDGLRPMLDVEDPGVGDDWISSWIKEFRRLSGIRRVIVYANRYYFTSRLNPDRWADEHVVLWLADYNEAPGLLRWNHPRLALHQYTESGRVAGFASPVDRNVTVNGYQLADLMITPEPIEVDDVMFQHVHLPPTTQEEVREFIIGLPWQGGAGGINHVWCTLGAANAQMRIRVAHWRIHEGGDSYPVAMVEDGTLIPALANTGGLKAPANTGALVIDYMCVYGGYVLIEASR